MYFYIMIFGYLYIASQVFHHRFYMCHMRCFCRRRHYLALSAPPLIPTKDPPFPGPGHYNIVNSNHPVKHLVSSAAFLSGTSRWTQDVKGQDIPGPGNTYIIFTSFKNTTSVAVVCGVLTFNFLLPGFYEPMVLSKTSFLYNPAKMWMPA